MMVTMVITERITQKSRSRHAGDSQRWVHARITRSRCGHGFLWRCVATFGILIINSIVVISTPVNGIITTHTGKPAHPQRHACNNPGKMFFHAQFTALPHGNSTEKIASNRFRPPASTNYRAAAFTTGQVARMDQSPIYGTNAVITIKPNT